MQFYGDFKLLTHHLSCKSTNTAKWNISELVSQILNSVALRIFYANCHICAGFHYCWGEASRLPRFLPSLASLCPYVIFPCPPSPSLPGALPINATMVMGSVASSTTCPHNNLTCIYGVSFATSVAGRFFCDYISNCCDLNYGMFFGNLNTTLVAIYVLKSILNHVWR